MIKDPIFDFEIPPEEKQHCIGEEFTLKSLLAESNCSPASLVSLAAAMLSVCGSVCVCEKTLTEGWGGRGGVLKREREKRWGNIGAMVWWILHPLIKG